MTTKSWLAPAVVLVAYLAVFFPGTGVLSSLAAAASPDGELLPRTLYTMWAFGFVDVATAIAIVYWARRRGVEWRHMFALALLVAAQAVFLLDRRLCAGEAYALKYPTVVGLLVAAGFAVRHLAAGGLPRRVAWFLGLAAFGFLVAGFDEAYLLHENLGAIFIEPYIGSGRGAVLGPFSHPDDLITLGYAASALALLAVFYRPLSRLPKSAFLTLLLAGLLAQVGGSYSELAGHDCAEEYLELAAAACYALALWSFRK